jgi:hypothetical protein
METISHKTNIGLGVNDTHTFSFNRSNIKFRDNIELSMDIDNSVYHPEGKGNGLAEPTYKTYDITEEYVECPICGYECVIKHKRK